MIQQAFSIYDTAASIYSPPFFQITKGLAIRIFTDTARDKTTNIGLHPNDYTLFYLGEFNDNTGQMLPLDTPEPIIKANEISLED